MVPELLIGFKNNLTQKSRNPFFGTLLIVWCTKNWELIYSIIFFPASISLQERLKYIREFFQTEGFYVNLFVCIGISILVMIGTYALFFGSKYIVELYDKILIPIIGKWTDEKSSIVTKERFESIKFHRDQFEKKWEDERNRRIELQAEYDKLESDLSELQLNFQKLKDSNEVHDVSEEFLSMKQKVIEDDYMTEELLDIGVRISSGRTLDTDNENVKYFIRHDVIELATEPIPDRDGQYFRFTILGNLLYTVQKESSNE